MRLLPAQATWYCTEDRAQLLRSHGIGRLTDALSSLPRNSDRKHPHKDVHQVVLNSTGSSQVVYIKRQWAWERYLPRWSEVRDGIAGRPDPVREWRGLRAMAAAGLNVPEPWVLFRDRRPLSPQAALIVSAVPVVSSLAELLSNQWLHQLHETEQVCIATAVASVVRRIESAGLRWRSMKAKHFFPEHSAQDGYRMWLIDCEGVRIAISHRQHRRDRETLLRSLEMAGAPVAFVSQVISALVGPAGPATSRCHVRSILNGTAASAT